MKHLSLVAVLVSGWLASGCGAQDPAIEQPTPAPEETTPPPAEAVAQPEATPPPAEAPAAEATPPVAEPVAPAALSVAVEGLTKGASGPSKDKLQVTAAAETNAIVVSLANYSHYCSPAPSFTA